MTTTTTTASSGSCLMFPLFVVFLVLKLTGNVAWSWWIITLPLWIGPVMLLAVSLAALLGYGGIVGGASLLDKVGFGRYLQRRRVATMQKYVRRLK